MKIETKIRAAYLRQHENDVFSLNLTGNIRLVVHRNQQSNTEMYSGNSIRLIGDALAYWKAEDGYFVVCGSLHEIQALYAAMLHSFELFYCKCGDQDVITLREVPATARKRVSMADFVAQDTCAGQLTACDKAILERGDYREVT